MEGINLLIGKRIVQFLLTLIVLLLMFVTLLFMFSPTITVTRFAPFVTEIVNSSSGLEISIGGEITIKPGIDTLVLLEELYLSDEKAAGQPFLSIAKSEISLDLRSVLNEQINIQNITLSDVMINVVHQRDKGFNIPDLEVLELMQWVDKNIAHIPPFIARDVQLKHVLINFSDLENNLSGQWLFDEIDVGWGWDYPLTAFGEGVLKGNVVSDIDSKPITISVNAGSMRHLGDKSLLWDSTFHIAANEGDVLLKLALAPAAEESQLDSEEYLRVYKLDVGVKQLQYGDLLTRLGVAAKLGVEGGMTGHIGAEISLEGNVSDLGDPLLTSSGVVEVSVWPQNQLANVIDFWATNIVNMVLKGMNSDSTINCAVARFNLSDGVLNSEVMVFDTSRLRVYGDGSFDLSNNNIDFLIIPKTKQIQWLDKSVPVRLIGALEEPEIEVQKVGLFKSVAKSVINFSIPLLPILINDTMESDGSKECLESMQKNRGSLKD